MTKLVYECHPLGDSAIVIRLGSDISLATLQLVRQVAHYLENNWQKGFLELVPAYTTITIFYDAFRIYNYTSEAVLKSGQSQWAAAWHPYDYVLQHIVQLLENYKEGTARQLGAITDIPVCYEAAYGPDLEEVANYHKVSTADIVTWHTSRVYPVYMIGFAPGFPYLGGMDGRLTTPRKSVPRTRIPAGSVGIGGAQTGIYPFETPGGWQLIGRTPLRLFRPDTDPPSLLKVGDHVKFVAISSGEFQALEEGIASDGL
ncbi:5-oxoprolinase subunit PxpB [Paenibacillus qinlingensis]|uniref:Inhibitor of KinA n=1 Tax=Paenibacillus qinlingensis TaxID=1837343 RepID=A0ABU1P4C6_9BACL|nr:5-oxoprolinase subunit PxpB [Paenibacillus qinlingensis]MDR6554596.1 inhibitor of KinA [Paenibacillus qinlingensis]